MTVLVLAAHPDDEVLMAGGTIAKLAEAGKQVVVAIANKCGIATRGYIPEVHGDFLRRSSIESFEPEIEALLESLDYAMDVLAGRDGIKPITEVAQIVQLNHHVVALSGCGGHLPVTHWVENLLDKYDDVKTVITHNKYSLNSDHKICYEAAVVATRPTKDRNIALLCGEVPGDNWGLFKANCYSQLSGKHLFLKARAMVAYEGELRNPPHPRSIDGIGALAWIRGSESGFDSAEAFIAERLEHFKV